MKPISDFPHLNDAAKALVHASDAERIRAIRSGTWLGYPRAKEILARMEDLLDYPRITRMPNMLLVAPSFNGKTSILERFKELHPPDLDPTKEATLCPVVMVEAPSTPDVSSFYSRILDALMAPYKPISNVQDKNSQIKLLFQKLGVKMHLMRSTQIHKCRVVSRQRSFRFGVPITNLALYWQRLSCARLLRSHPI
jgi:Bacterial TniB protein